MSSRFLITLSVFALLLSRVAFVYAQETPDFTNGGTVDPSSLSFPAKYPQIEEQIDVNISPETPRPGDEVTIKVEAYGTDLNTHLIDWKINGASILHGIGQKKFKFTMGKSGTITNVDLTISPKNAPEIKRSYTFAPVDVDILWQANTYTPPFYKGKSLYTPESTVMFTAIPNISIGGVKIDPSEAVYKWSENYEVQGDKSGFSKNTYEFIGPIILRPVTIQTEVYAAVDKNIKGVNSFELSNVYPQAIVYEDSPIYGVLYNRAVNNGYAMSQREVRLAVSPYYFSTDNKNDKVSYDWALDDSPLDIPVSENSTVFRRTDNSRGQAKISVGISEDTKALQSAGLDFIVSYEDTTAF
jgi:hypothetical protein